MASKGLKDKVDRVSLRLGDGLAPKAIGILVHSSACNRHHGAHSGAFRLGTTLLRKIRRLTERELNVQNAVG